MLVIHFNRKKIILPGSYNELSAKQLIAIVALQQRNKPDNNETLQLKVLQVLLGYCSLRFFLMPDELKARLIEPRGEENESLIDWVFKENTLTEQLLPCYHGYYGPKKEFDNIKLAEFHFTEVNYHDFITGDAEEKEQALNNLVAVLYRKRKTFYNNKKDKDGDCRVPFNSNVLGYYSKITGRWPMSVRLAILMYYDGCRQHIANSYEKIFKGGTGADHEAGMFAMIRGLAGEKYGDFDKVENLNIHTALNEIETQLAEAEAITTTT